MSREHVVNSLYRLYLQKGKGFVRIKEIVDETGLSRQLVSHHIKNLTQEGVCENVGQGILTNVDTELLAREIDSVSVGPGKRPQAIGAISPERAARLNAKIDLYYVMHKFLPKWVIERHGAEEAEQWRIDATPIKKSVLKEIDETIAHLKTVRKYANGSPRLLPAKRWARLTYRDRPIADIADGEFTVKDWVNLFPEEIADTIGNLNLWDDFVLNLKAEAGVKDSYVNEDDKHDDEWEVGE